MFQFRAVQALCLLPLAFCFLLLPACQSDDTADVPRPRAYPRVIYPERGYTALGAQYCDFTFERPQYANLERDTTFFDEKAGSDCWFNLDVPSLNAKIYCSYYPVTSPARFDELVQDAFVMAQKHNIKASYIEEIPVHRSAAHVHGMLFNIEGAAASPCQFYLTDSTHHFLRGALYFNAKSRPDSLAPVVEFLKKDVGHLVETLQWQR